MLQTECTFDAVMTGRGRLLWASPALMSHTSQSPLRLPHFLTHLPPSADNRIGEATPVWRSDRSCNVAHWSCLYISQLSGTNTARPQKYNSIHKAPGISVMNGPKYSSITSNCNPHQAVRTVDNKYKDKLAISQTDSEHSTVSSLRNVSGLCKLVCYNKPTISMCVY